MSTENTEVAWSFWNVTAFIYLFVDLRFALNHYIVWIGLICLDCNFDHRLDPLWARSAKILYLNVFLGFMS